MLRRFLPLLQVESVVDGGYQLVDGSHGTEVPGIDHGVHLFGGVCDAVQSCEHVQIAQCPVILLEVTVAEADVIDHLIECFLPSSFHLVEVRQHQVVGVLKERKSFEESFGEE